MAEAQNGNAGDLRGTYAVPDSVVAQSVGEETVLLHLESGTYYSLDRIGSEVWRGAEAGQTPEELADGLTARYEVTRTQALDDVQRLLDEAVSCGLLQPR